MKASSLSMALQTYLAMQLLAYSCCVSSKESGSAQKQDINVTIEKRRKSLFETDNGAQAITKRKFQPDSIQIGAIRQQALMESRIDPKDIASGKIFEEIDKGQILQIINANSIETTKVPKLDSLNYRFFLDVYEKGVKIRFYASANLYALFYTEEDGRYAIILDLDNQKALKTLIGKYFNIKISHGGRKFEIFSTSSTKVIADQTNKQFPELKVINEVLNKNKNNNEEVFFIRESK